MNNIKLHNEARKLALRYAEGIIRRRPGAAYMTEDEIHQAAKRLAGPSLLALAKHNLLRKPGDSH